MAKLTKADMESWLVADGRGIKIIGEYTNSGTKTTFECVHGHQWSVRPNSIRQGTGCPTCAITSMKLSKTFTKVDIESWLLEDGRGIKLVGDYLGSNKKTTFECLHGHQWDARPSDIRFGKGCPVCAAKARTHTKSDMESWLVADERGIKLIGEYTNITTKTTFECAHGHRWDTTPNSIKNGNGCPLCAGNIKLTKSDIESWLVTDGRGIKLIGDYLGVDTKTTFECDHGHQWLSTMGNVRSSSGCPICRKLTKEDFESWLLEDGRGIKLIGDYVNSKTKTTFECSDGHQWESRPDSIKNGRGCITCFSDFRTHTKSDIESWLVTDGRGIKLVGDYVNLKTKTTFECADGHQWRATTGNIKNGRGCPVCSPAGFNPGLPAWEYIFTRGSYLKYGITGNLNNRMARHRKYGELELVYAKHHENGQDALDWENQIKQKFGGKYVTDVICPDGWTETLPISHLKLLQEEKLIDKKRKVRGSK